MLQETFYADKQSDISKCLFLYLNIYLVNIMQVFFFMLQCKLYIVIISCKNQTVYSIIIYTFENYM